MRDFMHGNCCAKGFFSEIIILEGHFFAPKRISRKLAGIGKKLKNYDPFPEKLWGSKF